MFSFIVQMEYISGRAIVHSFQSLHLCIMQYLWKMSHLSFQHIKQFALYLRCVHSETSAPSPTDLDTGHHGDCLECNRVALLLLCSFHTHHSEDGHAESPEEESAV